MAPNPAWRLVHALSTLKDDRDNITVELLAHVRPPTEAELVYIHRIPFNGARMKANWGLNAFVNDMSDEDALTWFITAPTRTICGLRSGFIEDGEMTVLPSSAMVKLDFRLVPDLTPELVLRLLRAHLDRRGYADIEIYPAVGMVGARSDVNAPLVQTAIAVARKSTAMSRSSTRRTAAPGRCTPAGAGRRHACRPDRRPLSSRHAYARAQRECPMLISLPPHRIPGRIHAAICRR